MGGSIELDAEASGGRRRRFVYGNTQREVLDKLDELRRKLDLGLQIATGRGMTVGEYLTSWARDTLTLQVESGDLRASTADSYRDLVARHRVPGLARTGWRNSSRRRSARSSQRSGLQRRRTNEVTPSGRRRSTLVEVDPKTEGSVRTLALPDVLVEALRQQRRVQTAERLAARTWVDASLGFTTSVGTALEPRNVSRSWERVCERAGIDRHLRIHDLRHAAASFLLLQGADLRTVMEQLGHSRLATTSDVYVHVLDQVTRDAASRMDGFLRTIAGP